MASEKNRAVGEREGGLHIMEQAEFTFNENCLSEEKKLLSEIDW